MHRRGIDRHEQERDLEEADDERRDEDAVSRSIVVRCGAAPGRAEPAIEAVHGRTVRADV